MRRVPVLNKRGKLFSILFIRIKALRDSQLLMPAFFWLS